ncbi:MAG: archease [Dissulfurimicrobium sp.]|uniref:archease n=1 Tax=Dissulfurimicrobium TaxID=1769732 RepID=UPI001EDB6B65|nr:archease [Dissulfurimicrobium hydrothermale]UKL13184.1 archease [Dissulfurimicrobium hydrothermale]
MERTSLFETFEHGADIGIRGIGPTLEQAFENGAKALFSIIVINFSSIKPVNIYQISCFSFDLEPLFTSWINQLLAEADINRCIFSDFKINHLDLDNFRLSALAFGEFFDTNRFERGVDVKGATFTELKVYKRDGFWIAQCVVDV